MTPTTTVTPQVQNTEKPKIIVGKFTGMLSGFQKVVYRDLKYAGLEDKVAHKVAMDYGSQLGVAMRNDDNIKTAVTKANSHGQAKLSASFHDRLLMHDAMALYRVVQTIADLHSKERLIASYEVFGVLKLSDDLDTYITKCELWATEQEWTE